MNRQNGRSANTEQLLRRHENGGDEERAALYCSGLRIVGCNSRFILSLDETLMKGGVRRMEFGGGGGMVGEGSGRNSQITHQLILPLLHRDVPVTDLEASSGFPPLFCAVMYLKLLYTLFYRVEFD